MAKKQKTIYIEAAIIDAIQEEADKKKRSFNFILEEKLKKEKEK